MIHWSKPAFIGFLAALSLPLASVRAQTTAGTPAPPPATAGLPADLSPGAAEVVKLAQSGVGDDVVLAFIKNSHKRYNLSANNLVYLKGLGFSEPVLKAMVSHDGSLGPRRAAVAAAAAPGQYTYEQRLYSPAAQAASASAFAQPVAPGQPVPPAQPVAPGQPQLPGQPALPAQPIETPTTQPPTQPSVIVDQPPPVPQPEVVPLAPGPAYVWVPGFWSWRGGWVWVGGSWVLRPGTGTIWLRGHWAPHGHGWIWVRGRWH